MGLNQDLDDIKAIEDKLTANKVAKFAYTDHAYNNPLTEADGVTYYNVDNEQNIPVADPSVLNVNDTVLTKGWRSQASSITRMLMNHFLGRVSYNLNKLNDNMSALLITLRTNLSDVVNTGDSATPVSGGTTKFTTGGAYTELNKKADKVVSATNDDVATLDANGNLKDSGVPLTSLPSADNSKNAQYFLSKANRTGTTYWSIEVSHKTTSFLSGVLTIIDRLGSVYNISLGGSNTALQPTVYRMDNRSRANYGAISAFAYDSTTASRNYCKIFVKSNDWDWDNICYVSAYQGGDIVTVQTDDERTTDGTDFNSATPLSIKDFATTDIVSAKADLSDLAPSFSASTAYAVGDYVIYSRDLYRCTVAHSAGAWNSSHFTVVTVGGELETKADKTSLALPTDAVLHYSFDEVPDYPDGTAVYKHIKDFTSTSDWNVNSNRTVLSLDNNGLKAQSTGTDGYVQTWGTQTDASNISNKIVKIKWHSNANCTLYLQDLTSPYVRHNIRQKSLGNNVYEAIGYTESFSAQQSLFFLFYSVSAENYIVIDEIYIGDGSYSTPVIDNANGQNNATNNGGIAVQGISGKGLKFFKSNYVSSGTDFQFSENFSCSIWCKPEDFSSNCHIIRKLDVITLIIMSGNLSIFLDDSNHNALLNSYTLSELTINRFTHIVIVRNGLQFKYYKDGVLTKTVNLANSTIAKSNNPLTIGSNLTAVNHTEDDLLIFDRALTDDEVMALYLNKANTPKYYGEVPVTRKISGHTLEEDITLTKADVGLGNVSNTGDSAVPAKNGTEKFTTGGAFDFFGKQTDANAWLGRVFCWALGKTWSVGTGINYSYTFNSVYHANGIWVAGSTSHGLWWSTDGKAWTQGTGNTTYTFNSVYYANGIWVAGSFGYGLWWSTDGKAWTQGTGVSTTSVINSVYYAYGIWVSVCENVGVRWSTDGKTWTQGTGDASSGTYYTIGYNPNNGLWVVGGANGVCWSTDGKAWTQGTGVPTTSAIRTVYYADDIWVAGSTDTGLWWSTDGKAWTQSSNTSGSFRTVYYANGIWVAGSTATGLWRSTNGKAWSRRPTVSSAFRTVYYANGIWVAGSNEYSLWYSDFTNADIQ